jgi:integrase
MAKELLKPLDVQRLPKGRHSDGGNLYLQVTGSTKPYARSWVFRYQLDGKERWMGLGSARDVSLKRARELAAVARQSKAEKVDPLKQRQQKQAAERLQEARAVRFRECAENYIAAHQDGWRNEKHCRQWQATLAAYVYPHIGALPVQDIDTDLVLKVLEPIWKTKTETATRVRGRIEQILDYASARGTRSRDIRNPAQWKGHLDKLLAEPARIAKVEHHAALAYAEIGTFMADLRKRDSTSARAFEFLILTAARRGEVLGMQWPEVDLAKKEWTVPAGRMKAHKEHRVPLSDRAVEILRHQEARCEGPFVFTGMRGGALSITSLTEMLKVMGRTVTAHGFRSTFRDWAAERTNFPGEVAEMALAHAIESKVEAAYKRTNLFEKRRKLMDAWASYCSKQDSESGKVISIGARHA